MTSTTPTYLTGDEQTGIEVKRDGRGKISAYIVRVDHGQVARERSKAKAEAAYAAALADHSDDVVTDDGLTGSEIDAPPVGADHSKALAKAQAESAEARANQTKSGKAKAPKDPRNERGSKEHTAMVESIIKAYNRSERQGIKRVHDLLGQGVRYESFGPELVAYGREQDKVKSLERRTYASFHPHTKNEQLMRHYVRLVEAGLPVIGKDDEPLAVRDRAK